MGGAFDAYVLDLHDPERAVTGPASVYLAPKGPRAVRVVIEKTLAMDPIGARLQIERYPFSEAFLCAFADTGSCDLSPHQRD